MIDTVDCLLEKLRYEWADIEGQFSAAFEDLGRVVDYYRSNRQDDNVDRSLANLDALRKRQSVINQLVKDIKKESGRAH